MVRIIGINVQDRKDHIFITISTFTCKFKLVAFQLLISFISANN